MRSARWTTTAIAPAVVALCLSGCASVSVPISPTIRAMGTIQLREQSTSLQDEWILPGESHARYLHALEAWAATRGIAIARTSALTSHGEGLLGRTKFGDHGEVRIDLNADVSVNSQLYTVLHELAHLYQAHNLHRSHAEVFAELVAYQVCQRLGLDGSWQTGAYLHAYVPLAEQWAIAQRDQAEVDAVVNMLTHAARGGS